MVTFDDVQADLSAAGVGLRRAWPRSEQHLLLDLDQSWVDQGRVDSTGEGGGRVAGQWFADLDLAREIAAATVGAERRGRVVLQPAGADRRLGGLATLLRQPGSRLVAHRPERRAVVALPGGAPDDSSRFAKLVPPRRLGGLRHTALRASQLPIRTPRVLSDHAESMLVTEELPGTALSALLSGPRADEALQAVGAALAQLHCCPAPAGSTVHGLQDEVAVTTRWENWAHAYGLPIGPTDGPIPSIRPESDELVRATPRADFAVDASTAKSCADGSATMTAPGLRVIHRDLHDGQVLLTTGPDGHFYPAGVGLLDFDLIAAGDPALDLANLVEHLLLRKRQGVLADAGSAVRALLDGYDPDQDVLCRVNRYRTLTARRLAALYSFRAPNLAT